MNDFTDTVITGPRRLQILRFLVELKGEASENIVFITMRKAGYASAMRDDIRGDLDHLHKIGCTIEEWLGDVRLVRLTERGQDVAHGRIAAAGVEHEIGWKPGA